MSQKRLSALQLSGVTATALLAVACGDGGNGIQTGYLSLGIEDAPVDAADEIVLQVHGVELKPKVGQAFYIEFASPKLFDLVKLQDGKRAMLLDGEEVPAGEYLWARVTTVAESEGDGDSSIMAAGAQCESRIPSGDETAYEAARGFTVGVGSTTDFTARIDLPKTAHRRPDQSAGVDSCGRQAYLLKPVTRLVNHLEVGFVSGTVEPTLVSEQCANSTRFKPGSVYLFGPYETDVPMPVDYDGIAGDLRGGDALASAMVSVNENTNYVYSIAWVPAGDYFVAYTCDPDQSYAAANHADSPAGADEAVTFVPVTGLVRTVSAGQTTAANFTLEP